MKSDEPNPECSSCDEKLSIVTTWNRGHKTACGYECNNDSCPEGWWHFTEWIDQYGSNDG